MSVNPHDKVLRNGVVIEYPCVVCKRARHEDERKEPQEPQYCPWHPPSARRRDCGACKAYYKDPSNSADSEDDDVNMGRTGCVTEMPGEFNPGWTKTRRGDSIRGGKPLIKYAMNQIRAINKACKNIHVEMHLPGCANELWVMAIDAEGMVVGLYALTYPFYASQGEQLYEAVTICRPYGARIGTSDGRSSIASTLGTVRGSVCDSLFIRIDESVGNGSVYKDDYGRAIGTNTCAKCARPFYLQYGRLSSACYPYELRKRVCMRCGIHVQKDELAALLKCDNTQCTSAWCGH